MTTLIFDILRPKSDAIKADLDDLKFIRNCVIYLQREESTENDVTKEKGSVLDRLHKKQEIISERERQKRDDKTQPPQK